MGHEKILMPLEQVQRRRRVQRIFEGASWGLLIGAVASLPPLSVFLLGALPSFSGMAPLILCLALLSFGLLTGIAIGLLRPFERNDSAKHVDRHYRFKDRLLTAMKLLPRNETSAMERLQLEDAARHAEKIDPRGVVPYRLPRNFAWSLGLALAAVGLSLLAPVLHPRQNLHAAEKLPEVVSTIELLQENLVEKIEELAEQNSEETALKELAEKLRDLMTKLDDSASETKKSLATLSEMEEAVRAAMSQFQVESVDASLQELAEALSAADATRAAGQALKEEQYAKAAGELEKMETGVLTRQERKAVSEQLREGASSMKNRGQKTLAAATEKLAGALQEGNESQGKEGAGELAGECRKQSLRKGICEGLQGKLSLLGLCKSECNGGAENCNSKNNGGNNTDKSDSSSQNWGTGEAGLTPGEETSLDGKREQKNITGILGEGDSEVERIRTSEANEESAGREFREQYREYRKMSEAVLESEPIPLGQRQMIRRYFESIRPKESEE